jgi:phospholipid/cholesterol/gamma-HCH transport system ATP-binding protein
MDVMVESGREQFEDGTLMSVERALRDAISVDSASVDRLCKARTSVSFGLDDAPGERITLQLSGDRPTLVRGGEAENHIEFERRQAALYARGMLHLQAELECGELALNGQAARRFLQVDPILRGLLTTVPQTRAYRADGSEYSPTLAPRRHDNLRPLDADLLAIETRNLHKAFGSNRILRGVDLGIPEGAISVVMGPSGTGKSVLLSHIIGLLKPNRGDVLVRGRSLAKMTRKEILDLRTEIGVMFQDGALFSTLNLYDNVAFPLRQHTDLNEAEVREIVMTQLAKVGLANATTRRPPELSGGMRKRAGLARAMVLDPGIILCDEPDSGLDPVRTALLGDLLVETHAELGGTMVVITHNIELARRVADHIAVLWRGKLVESGSAEHVLESDNQFIRQFLAGESRGPLGMDA